MGIQGLLPFLRKIHTPVNVAQFEGCTVAIDAYCWLHKGAFSCAEKLAMGEKTDQYVYYCMKFIEYLLRKNIKPIMVFDGCHLPSKKDVEKTRREKREMNRKKAAQLLREGKRSEARDCLQRCIDISPEMALELMNVCRARGVDCIVAPYEADSQLAYLNRVGIAQIIITEDSDLLLFGCEKVIFKMDHFGNGMMIEKNRLNEVLEIQSGFYTFEKFRRSCILSGCDYLPSLPGIGLVKACKVFKVARQEDVKQLLKKIPTYLKMNVTVTDQYVEGFIQADNTFLYQLCYDPLVKKLVPLNPYTDDIDPGDLPYAGPYIPEEKAYQIALGNINIYTKQKFADFDPVTYLPPKASRKPKESLHMRSIWDKNYRIRPKVGLKETQNIERPCLGGKEVKINNKIFKKKSPQKRKTQAEEKEKLDKALSELYDSDSSPQKKRLKLDVDDDDSNSDIVSGADSVVHLSPKKALTISSSPHSKHASPQQRLKNSPRKKFFESLVEADSEISPCKKEDEDEDLSPSPNTDNKNDVQEEKENNILSPRRNKFAVLSASKKARFDLNASKEVKSRFFLSSADDDVKAEVKEEEPELQQNQLIQERLSDKSPESGASSKRNEKIIQTSNFQKPATNSPSGSAFSWSGFKFSRTGSANDLKSKSNVKPVNKQFKKVVSDSNLKQYLKKEDTEPQKSLSKNSSPLNRLDSSDSLSIGRTDSQMSLGSDVSQQSSHSNLYSIDSDCMPDSQDICNVDLSQGDDDRSSEKDSNVCTKNALYTKSYSSDRLNTLTEEKSPVNLNTSGNGNSMASKTINKAGPLKSGCRVSGLSKGKKNKSIKNGGDSTKQQNIKDLFSKFAHNKNNIDKLKPSKQDDDIDDDDLEITAVTPSQEKSALNVTGGIQRNILP